MDYEKKYNEALERASHIKDNNTVATPQEVAEHIFPELHESEDERIRKELISYLHAVIKEVGELGHPKIDRWISYLEKQEEQKPIQSNIEKEYIRTIKSLISDFIRGKRDIDTGYYQKIYDWLDGRHIEQKPAEWSKEDEKMIWDIVDVLEADNVENKRKFPYVLSPHEHYKKMVDWLKSLRLQSKQEWSKEDEENIESIKIILRKALSKGISCEAEVLDLTDWLQSLHPQPKQKWGEKDEKMREKLINFLGSPHVPLTYEEFSEYRSWLISLRPKPSWKPSSLEKGALRTAISILTEERGFHKAAAQLQNILDAFDGVENRHDWKPSEKQMDALETTAHLSNFGCDTGRRNTLLSLCNDLKKL